MRIMLGQALLMSIHCVIMALLVFGVIATVPLSSSDRPVGFVSAIVATLDVKPKELLNSTHAPWVLFVVPASACCVGYMLAKTRSRRVAYVLFALVAAMAGQMALGVTWGQLLLMPVLVNIGTWEILTQGFPEYAWTDGDVITLALGWWAACWLCVLLVEVIRRRAPSALTTGIQSAAANSITATTRSAPP